jgi:nucleoside-diphosphate-sugar epimerase
MKVIVTGGAGFLGQHLCRALAKTGYQVKVIDLKPNPEFETIIADVRDAQKMQEVIKDAMCVFHLAALIEAGESVKEPQKFVDSNISGSVSVLEAMRINKIPMLIFSSSAAVYGEPQRVPVQEDDRTMPINPYGMTKLAVEGLMSSYVASHGITGIALRYFNLYGPGENHQPETHAIPRFVSQIFHDQELTVWGSGEHQRDYIFIQDVVDAHLKAVELGLAQPNKYHYFNLSTEQPKSVIEIARLVEKYMGKSAKITHFPPRPGDPLVLTASAQKAHEQLGWTAQTSLEDGLRQTVEYFMGVLK